MNLLPRHIADLNSEELIIIASNCHRLITSYTYTDDNEKKYLHLVSMIFL